MFVLDLLLLPLGAVIFPNPRVERVFIHAKVTRGLGNGLIRLDGQLHRAFLKCSGILFRSGLTHRTHLLGCVLSLVSVCPEEYSHIRDPTTHRLKRKLATEPLREPGSACTAWACVLPPHRLLLQGGGGAYGQGALL